MKLRWLGLVIIVLLSCDDVINDPDEDLQRKGISIDVASLQNSWELTEFFNDGLSQTDKVFSLSFNADKTISVKSTGGSTEGNWALAKENKLLIIRINSSDELIAALNDDWVVLKLTTDELQIAEEDLEDDTRFSFTRKEEVIITEAMLTDFWRLALYQEGNNQVPTESLILHLEAGNEAEIIRENGLLETGNWQLNAIQKTLILNLGNQENSGKILSANWEIEELKGDTLKLESANNRAIFTRYKDSLPLLTDFLEHEWTVQNIDPLPGDDADEFPQSKLLFENGVITWYPYNDDDDDDEGHDDEVTGAYSIENLQLTIAFEEDDDEDEGYWNGEYTIETLNEEEFRFSNNTKSVILKR